MYLMNLMSPPGALSALDNKKKLSVLSRNRELFLPLYELSSILTALIFFSFLTKKLLHSQKFYATISLLKSMNYVQLF